MPYSIRRMLMFKRPFLLCMMLVFAKLSSAQTIAPLMAKYAENYTSERLYIHFDKSTYVPGETIWFKSYVMKAILPTDLSKTIYFDLSDENGNLLAHKSAPLIAGVSFGQFDIPDDYKGNFLHMRAYTRWMLNFDTAFLFDRDIKILQEKVSKVPQAIKPMISFMPEGGSLVAGVVNKVAFKSTDQFGKPLNLRGVVVNKKGTIIDSIIPLHDGMGYFTVLAEQGENYTAKWTPTGGLQQETSLPQVQTNAVALKIGISTKQRTFSIAAPNYPADREVEVVGTMFNQPVFNFKRRLTKGVTEGIIPVGELPSGILVITVFDDQRNPLAERITFIKNDETIFQPEITVQHWGLNKRAKNEVEIAIPDSMVANLSVSITDYAIDADTSDNIISHMLLTSELKGKIYNPAFYFMNNSDSLEQFLDLVMLTHGWRNYNWDQITKGQFPSIKYQPDTNLLTFSGKVYGASPVELQKPGNNIVLLFNEKDKVNDIQSLPIEPDGSFRDHDLILFDSIRVYYQLPATRGFSSATVQFMKDRFPALSTTVKASGNDLSAGADTSGLSKHLALATARQEELRFNQLQVLENIKIERRQKSPVQILDEKYASGMFQGGDGYQFDLLNDPFAASAFNIFNYLQGKVPGLQINTASNPPTFSWRGGTPGLYLDEMPTTADMLSSIPVTDIAYVKVLRPPFLGAMNGGSGGIAIYTRRGDDVQRVGKGLDNNTITGYSPIKQFFSPDYSRAEEGHEKKDLRTTLYWNPEITVAPGQNKALLTFYNNDVTEAFRVVVQGMTTDGRLASVVYIME